MEKLKHLDQLRANMAAPLDLGWSHTAAHVSESANAVQRAATCASTSRTPPSGPRCVSRHRHRFHGITATPPRRPEVEQCKERMQELEMALLTTSQ